MFPNDYSEPILLYNYVYMKQNTTSRGEIFYIDTVALQYERLLLTSDVFLFLDLAVFGLNPETTFPIL